MLKELRSWTVPGYSKEPRAVSSRRAAPAAALALALVACPAPRPTIRPPPLPLAPVD